MEFIVTQNARLRNGIKIPYFNERTDYGIIEQIANDVATGEIEDIVRVIRLNQDGTYKDVTKIVLDHAVTIACERVEYSNDLVPSKWLGAFRDGLEAHLEGYPSDPAECRLMAIEHKRETAREMESV